MSIYSGINLFQHFPECNKCDLIPFASRSCLIVLSVDRMNAVAVYIDEILELVGTVGLPSVFPFRKQEAQLMLTTGSTRLAVSRGQQT